MGKRINVKFILKILTIVLIIGLFSYFLFSEDGLVDLFKNPKRILWGWIVTALVCHIINLVADIYLIYKFTKNNNSEYKFTQAIKASMVGQFFSAVTPGASGGQPMQVYVMANQGVDSGSSTSSLIQKFLVYQTVLTAYSAIAILFRMDYFNSLNKVVWSLAVFGFASQAVVILTLILVSFCPRITKKLVMIIVVLLAKIPFLKKLKERVEEIESQIDIFHDSNREFYKNKSLVLESYVVTIVQLTSMFLIPYCIYRSLALKGESVFALICSQAFISMSTSFFPIPGASGAAEGASSVFFDPFFTSTTIKPAILMTRIISYYFTVLISLPFSYISKRAKKKEN